MFPPNYSANGSHSIEGFNPPADAPSFIPSYTQGLRTWYWDFEKMRLKSVTYGFWWENGENLASHAGNRPTRFFIQCATKYHPDNPQVHVPDCEKITCRYPTKDCTCGFYGYFSHTYYNKSTIVSSTEVAGVIAGWGRCVLGDLGFKSQFAQILALCTTPRMSSVVFDPNNNAYIGTRNKMRDQYGIETYDRLCEVLAASFEMAYPGVPLFGTVEEMIEAFPPKRTA